MGEACIRFNTPVTGGNVSFYNQSEIGGKTEAVFPTPTIGMLGIVQDKKYQTALSFRKKGDMIYLVGRSYNDIASSEYLYSYHKIKKSPAPHFDMDEEYEVQRLIKDLIRNNLIHSAHDISEGGLFVALLESAMPENFGFDITSDAEIRTDAFLFGESQSRVIVSVSASHEAAFIDFASHYDVPISTLGHVTKSEIRVDDTSFGFINDFKKLYDTSLESMINESLI
jgi:phosphoribosylformylglycinamidine synthase